MSKRTDILLGLLLLLCITIFIVFQLSETKEQRIDHLFKEFNNTKGIGASVLIVKEGNILFKKGYGIADMKTKAPATEYTNYRIASMTKQFTAMCIMILKEKGFLSYETKLTDIFSDFPTFGDKITIRNLLQHTSGLPDYYDYIPKDQTEQLKDTDVFNIIKAQGELRFEPGTKFEYCDGNYCILAVVVEKLSGMRFAEFLDKNVFKHLEMDNTVAYEKGISNVKNRAFGTWKSGHNTYIKKDQSITSATLGDGGIYTNIMDYYKWDQALYTDKLVSLKTLEEAFSDGVRQADSNDYYGFGWFYFFDQGRKILYHTGGTCGFTTAVFRIPESKYTIVLFTNYNELPIWRQYIVPIAKICHGY